MLGHGSSSTRLYRSLGRAGVHVPKFWMVAPAVVLQKLVVDAGGPEPSYPGLPESLRLS